MLDNITASELIEGRIALGLIIGYLGFALTAHVIVGRPASMVPVLITLGGLVTLLIQNALLELARSDDQSVDEEAAANA